MAGDSAARLANARTIPQGSPILSAAVGSLSNICVTCARPAPEAGSLAICSLNVDSVVWAWPRFFLIASRAASTVAWLSLRSLSLPMRSGWRTSSQPILTRAASLS
jgi:hypothetical protein